MCVRIICTLKRKLVVTNKSPVNKNWPSLLQTAASGGKFLTLATAYVGKAADRGVVDHLDVSGVGSYA